MTRKSVLRSVRLDDDVWAAVKAMDESLNQFLRDALINGAGIPDKQEPSRAAVFDGTTGELVSDRPYKPPLLKPSEKQGR